MENPLPTPSSAGAATEFSPVSREERYELIDVLRGFALCGVLVANFEESAAYFLTPGLAAALPGVDPFVLGLVRFVVRGKALFIFSLLFGLGLSIQMSRAAERGRELGPIYLRRLTVLLALGVVHLSLLWFIDILHMYALAGFVLFLFLRKRSDRFLLICGALLAYLPFTVLTWIAGIQALHESAPHAAAGISLIEAHIAGVTSGSYVDVLRTSWEIYRETITPPAFAAIVLYALGVFQLGYLVGRRRYLQDAPRHLGTFRRVLRWGLALGVPGNALVVYVHGRVAPSSPWFIPAHLPNVVSIIALAAAYVAAIVLAWQRPGARRALALLAPVGRMALTNYLMQSAFYVVVLTGVGFGLAGRIGSVHTLVIGLAFFAVQVAVSHLWLHFFRFGPVEWLWRSLTYARRQPWRA